jgi:hypothetical protein
MLDATTSIARSLKWDLSGRAASALRPPVFMRRRKAERIPSALFVLVVRAALKQKDVANQFIIADEIQQAHLAQFVKAFPFACAAMNGVFGRFLIA